MWNLHIQGLEGKTYIVMINDPDPGNTTVQTLKEKVKAKTGIEPSEQRIIYAGKQLEDDRKLRDYPPMKDNSVLMLVMRLPGGADSKPKPPTKRAIATSVPRSTETCMITMEDGNNLLMPCNHAISPDGLMDYCWSEVSMRKCEIRCCLCSAEWSIETLHHFSGASKEELTMLEVGLSSNFCKKSSSIMECPGCASFCERKDTSNNCVQCLICTRNKGSSYHFCWSCLRIWKNSTSAKECGNADCNTGVIQKLRDAPMISLLGVRTKAPQVRACPKCGSLIELADGCKHVACKKCTTEFCFICLRARMNGSWMCGSYNTECVLAPRQERIPIL